MLRIDTIRGRLTLFYVSVLAIALLVVGGLIYVLLARALYIRTDDNLSAVVQIAVTSLSNDLAEGQDIPDAARSTAAELSSRQQMLVVYNGGGRLLAEGGRDSDLTVPLPAVETIPSDDVLLVTVRETGDDDRHRLAMRRVTISPPGVDYIIVAGSSLEPIDDDLESLRGILAYVVPIALALAGVGGWFLARNSLRPVVGMADQARRIGVQDLSARLPVANPRDELGRLAETFNELLGRLEASLIQQRQFMADASHELRTPVTTARTAASVALQHPHRDEGDYREALEIVEQQADRLSRIVEDMFTLARADAGNYPVRSVPMYLDEVIDEVVRAAQVIASTKGVAIESTTVASAAFTGDEDLIRRLLVNLLDNATRHSPPGGTVRIALARIEPLPESPAEDGYVLSVQDHGSGIPPHIQPYIFERFYRGSAARTRHGDADGGAGLGLALVRWIARVHGGDVVLTRSSEAGTTFTAHLPVIEAMQEG